MKYRFVNVYKIDTRCSKYFLRKFAQGGARTDPAWPMCRPILGQICTAEIFLIKIVEIKKNIFLQLLNWIAEKLKLNTWYFDILTVFCLDQIDTTSSCLYNLFAYFCCVLFFLLFVSLLIDKISISSTYIQRVPKIDYGNTCIFN